MSAFFRLLFAFVFFIGLSRLLRAQETPQNEASFVTIDCGTVLYGICYNQVPSGRGKLRLKAESLQYDTLVVQCYPCNAGCTYFSCWSVPIGPLPQGTTVTISTTDCDWQNYSIELVQVSGTSYNVNIDNNFAGTVSLTTGVSNPPCLDRKSEIDAAAARYGVPRDLFRAVILQESSWRQFDPSIRCQPTQSGDDWGMGQINGNWGTNQYNPINILKAKWDYKYNLEKAARILWLNYRESILRYGDLLSTVQHWDNALAIYNNRKLPYVPQGKDGFWRDDLRDDNPLEYVNKVREKEAQQQWPC